MSDENKIVAFKGFDLQMQCRGHQFEVGKTYEYDGKVKACEGGFHSCENPLDVFNYYEPGISMFCEVEASGEISRHNDDSKVASGRLHIRAQLSLPDYIGRAFAYVVSKCSPATSKHVEGYRSASSATGYSSASSATGDSSASSASGIAAVALNTGRYGKARASEGGAIVLCEHDNDGNLLHIRSSKVGENGIKPDVFYTLRNGEFVEAA